MENFKPEVSVELQNQIKNLADVLLDDFISDFKESNGCSAIEEIDGNDRSGWIAFTKGGFTVREFYHNDIDSSYHFTKKQTEFNQEFYDDAIEHYKVDNELEEIDYDDYDFQQFENDIFDSALLRVDIFIDNKDIINIVLAVNYSDAPYFRTKHDEVLKELTFSIDDFMNVDFENIIEQLKNYK